MSKRYIDLTELTKREKQISEQQNDNLVSRERYHPLKETSTQDLHSARMGYDNSIFTHAKETSLGVLFQEDEEKILEAKRISGKLNISPEVILTDIETFKRSREMEKQYDNLDILSKSGKPITALNELYKMYPGLEELVENKDSMADAALYLKNLKNVREIQGVFEGFSTMYTQGDEEKEYYELSIEKAERLQSGKSLYAWTSDKEARLQELEEKRKNYKVLPTNIFDSPGGYIAGATGEQVPRMIDMGVEYAKTRGALTIGAGIVGGIGGGAAGFFGSAGVGTAPGAAAGAKAAMAFVQPYAHYAGMASSAYDISKESAGRNYEKYSNMRDANGKLVFTPEEAYKMAWTQGAVEGGIEVASFGAVGKIILGKAPARVKGLIAERLMKSEVAVAFAGGTINEATKATGRKIVADGLKGYFKVVGLESAEEGVQEFASMAIENLVFSMKRDEGFDVDSHSFSEMVASSLDATMQAVPASLGLGILGGVVSSPLHAVSYKRNQSLLRASEEQRAAMKNAEGQAVFDTLKEKKVLVELQQKSPELARDIFQKQAEKFDQGSWLLDVPSLLKHEGGMEVLQKIADAQKISSEQLKEIISSGADFKVQSGVLYQDVLNTPHEEIVRKNITLSENAPTIEKIEEEQARVEELKKMVDADLQEESKTTKKALDTFFPEKNKEREIASSILERNTTNPLIAWQEARLEAGEDYFNSLEPYLEYIEQNPNGKWAESYFKENPMKEGETLSLEQKVGIAEKMASGAIPIDMEVSQEQTETLQNAKERVQEIESIKDRITQVNEASSSITNTLTPEGVQVFTKVVERLKEVIKESGAKDARKSIRMGAVIFARFADTYARVKREAGVEGYTALDYYNEFIGIESGRTESFVAFSQPVTNKQLNSTSKVNVVDISSNIEVDPNRKEDKQEITQKLLGKNFSIQYSNGVGRVASLRDGRHLVGGSNNRLRKHPSRKKALTSIEKILANAVFVEKYDDQKNQQSGKKYIRLYSAVNDNGVLVIFRIVAKEGGGIRNNFEVKEAQYYEMMMEEQKGTPATPHSKESGHRQGVPSVITVADLLKHVNDIEGNPYIDEEGNLNTLYQNIQDARGYISIFDNGKRVINILETADASTFLHETAHEMLISLQELATMENAPEWIVKDFEAVKKYVGWQDGQTTFAREQQEQWATSFEAYLESGEAPTKGLRNVFRAFKKWLFDIYKDAVSQNVRATPEIEAVMVRLIASQEEIDMYLEEQSQFEEKGGMENSAKQSRDTYSKWVEEMREEAKEKLLAVAMEDLKNLTPEDIQREVDKERETYRAELEQEQIWQDQALYEASGKSESILESLGYKDIEDFEQQKEKSGGSLVGALEEHVQNYEARLKNPSLDLAFLRSQAEQIIVQDRYKDLKDAFEFEALRKKVRKEPGNKTFKVLQSEARKVAGSVKEVAKIKMDELLIPQAANFKMWLRKEQSANRKMLDALTKGKLEEALQQKNLQLTYSAMARIAMDNQEFYTKAKKKLKDRYKRMNRTTNRQRMPLAERYHYNDLMFKLGFSNARAFDPISEIPTIEKLFEGYNESMDLNGDVFPEWASERISKNQTIDADYLTMEEFQDLYNALNVIYTIGKDVDGLKTMDLSLDEVMGKMQESFEENFPEEKRVQKNLVEADSYNIGWGDTTQNYMLNIIQPIRLIERLGKPFIDTLSFIADQGDLREIELTQKVNKASKELFKLYSDQERHEMHNKKQFDLPRGGKLTKENLVVMGLNWGNEINRDRVLNGFQMTFEEATELLKNLNARDWKFIQGVWDLNETLWPETARVEERMNGVVLNKVQALPFEIVDREGNSHKLSGGYFHIAYNSKKSSRVAANEQMDLAKSFMPRNAIFGRGLGATKKRAQKYNNPPLLLDFSVITNHYSEAIHNISKRETIRDLNKIVSDPRFENIVSQAYGMEAYKKIQQWVKDIWGEEQVGANSSFVEKSVKRFRLSANMAIMGFRATTSLLNLANIAPMANRLGTGKALKAVLSFYSNPQQSYRFVMENSAMLRERAHTIDYTVNEIDKNIPRNIPVVGKVASKFLEVSYAPITWTDLMLSMPLWMQVYRDTVDSQLQGKESLEITKEIHEKAVFEGNRAVRDVFGSGLSKDLAPVQKGGGLSKALTPFYSFFNAQLNVVLDGWYEGKNTGNYSKMVKSIFFNFVLASVIAAFLRGLADGDDDEEGKFLKEFLNEFTGTAFGGFFGVRDVVNALMTLAVDGRVYGNGAPTSLHYQSAERAAAFFSTVRSIWNEEGNKDMIDFGRDLTKVFNSATGFPDTVTDAFWTSLRWFDNDFEDELWDYLRSVIFDKKLKKR